MMRQNWTRLAALALPLSVVLFLQPACSAVRTKLASDTPAPTAEGRDAARQVHQLTLDLRAAGRLDPDRLPLAGAVLALGKTTDQLVAYIAPGEYPATFFYRGAIDFVDYAHTLGKQVSVLRQEIGAHAAATPLRLIALRLLAIQTSGDPGNDDATYWRDRFVAVRSSISGIRTELLNLSQSLTAATDATTVPLKTVVGSLGAIASQHFQAFGQEEPNYWMRASRDLVLLANGVGGALAPVAPAASEEAIRALLVEKAKELSKVENYGTGDASYWRAKAAQHHDLLRGVGYILTHVFDATVWVSARR